MARLFCCQPELVEGGAIYKRSFPLELTRLRQAQADRLLIRGFTVLKFNYFNFI
jgi:hypothetical protein